jgi:DNA-binding NtrC family response regulator
MPFILVVDDEEIIRVTFSMALRHFGFRALEARNVQQAKELIQAFDFHAILSDVLLPDGDGEEILEAAHKKKPETPVIMMTGFPTSQSKVRSKALNAYAYLHKPVTIDEVVAIIREAIGSTDEDIDDSIRNVVIENTDGQNQIYPVPLTLEERELLIGMVMHQLIELEEYHTKHAREGRRILNSINEKMKQFA